jgi:hypothetical protein
MAWLIAESAARVLRSMLSATKSPMMPWYLVAVTGTPAWRSIHRRGGAVNPARL